LPGLALALEPEERTIMQRPPRPPDESVFARGMGYQVLWTGILIGGITLAVQWWAMAIGSPNWQTMAFTSLTMCQMFIVLAIRSDREGLHAIGVLSNKHLAGAVLFTFLLQLAVIYVPALNPIFKTAPLNVQELAIALLLPAVVLVMVELEKVAIRRGWLYRERPGTQPLAQATT
jgi:Ca2+-transporting ATPase